MVRGKLKHCLGFYRRMWYSWTLSDQENSSDSCLFHIKASSFYCHYQQTSFMRRCHWQAYLARLSSDYRWYNSQRQEILSILNRCLYFWRWKWICIHFQQRQRLDSKETFRSDYKPSTYKYFSYNYLLFLVRIDLDF